MNYEKALEKAKERYLKIKDSDSSEKSFLLEIFPELAESEDEKIIKWLIGYFKQYKADGMEKYANGLKVDNILAWLEKQGKEEYALKSFKDEDVRKFMQYIEKQAKAYEFNLPNRGYDIYAFAKDILYWLEKQGEFKSSKWTEGDVVRHGGVLALVTNGRKAMKSNCEQITIQYPDEWVKAETKERKYFFEELEKQGKQSQGKSALEVWKDMRLEVYQQASGNRHEPNYSDDSTKMFSLNDIDEIVEKMSEQSPADKVEPKFKVGDWVVYDHRDYQVVETPKKGYINLGLRGNGKIEFAPSTYCRPWTIQDAKDGDVLVSKFKQPFIYNGNYDEYKVGAYCGIVCDGSMFIETNTICQWTDNKEIKPATKEQRNILFSKMIESGYEWDADKKELKKMEHKPKFKHGDWIIFNGLTLCINEVVKGYYRTISIGGILCSYDWDIDKIARLWTIQDAKDGDVLASELCDSIILFKSIKDNNIDFYCDYDFSKIDIPGDRFSVNNGQHYGNVEDSKDFHPATKEQRDLLFQKMHEAGYEWDVEKKELEKIPNALEECEIEPFEAEHGKYYYCIKDYFCGGRKQASKGDVVQALRGLPIMGLKDASEYFLPVNSIEQKHAWSEEDDYNLQCMIAKVTSDIQKGNVGRNQELIDWLKSLRPQKQWKPSEEQLEALESATANCAYSEYQDCLKELLKKLKGE